jgi:hypothetical protein
MYTVPHVIAGHIYTEVLSCYIYMLSSAYPTTTLCCYIYVVLGISTYYALLLYIYVVLGISNYYALLLYMCPYTTSALVPGVSSKKQADAGTKNVFRV